MSESLNSKMNHKLLMRIGDVPLRYADQINITSDGEITGDSYTLNYNANHVINDDVIVGLKFNNGMVSYDESTTNIGGGVTPEPPSTEGFKVQYFDYDGTILKTEYVLTGGTSTPPVTPTHDLLTFNSWNNDNTNITRDTDIGAIYDTTDGKTHCFVTMTLASGYQPTIYLNKTGSTDITVDWGDGEVSISGGTGNLTIRKPTPYNSGSTGIVSYDITIDCDDVYGFGNPSLNRSIFYNQPDLGFKKCYVGDNVTSLGNRCFHNCATLQSITIPSSVTNLGNYCFYSCKALQSIAIPSSVTNLGSNCFEECYTLQSITMPNLVTSLGISCFNSCYALQSITIPSSVTNLGENCINSCYPLQSITIPNSVTSLGDYCFYNCATLQSITISNSVTSLGIGCFSSCSALQSITIPSSVTNLGDSCFDSCYVLQFIIFTPTTPPIIGVNIYDVIYKPIIYVPDASLEAYRTAPNLSTYANRIYPISAKPIE